MHLHNSQCWRVLFLLFVLMLPFLLLTAVISLPLHFSAFFEFLYWCIYTILNAGESSSSFFVDTYSLSISTIECKALCVVINLFFLWSISRSSCLVHFKNGPEYLTSFTLHYPFCYTYFLPRQSVVDGHEFLKPESMNPIMAWRFPIWYFLGCCSQWFLTYVRLGDFFKYLLFLVNWC